MELIGTSCDGRKVYEPLGGCHLSTDTRYGEDPYDITDPSLPARDFTVRYEWRRGEGPWMPNESEVSIDPERHGKDADLHVTAWGEQDVMRWLGDAHESLQLRIMRREGGKWLPGPCGRVLINVGRHMRQAFVEDPPGSLVPLTHWLIARSRETEGAIPARDRFIEEVLRYDEVTGERRYVSLGRPCDRSRVQ